MPQKARFVRKKNNQGKAVLIQMYSIILCFTVGTIIQMQCDSVLAAYTDLLNLKSSAHFPPPLTRLALQCIRAWVVWGALTSPHTILIEQQSIHYQYHIQSDVSIQAACCFIHNHKTDWNDFPSFYNLQRVNGLCWPPARTFKKLY